MLSRVTELNSIQEVIQSVSMILFNLKKVNNLATAEACRCQPPGEVVCESRMTMSCKVLGFISVEVSSDLAQFIVLF